MTPKQKYTYEAVMALLDCATTSWRLDFNQKRDDGTYFYEVRTGGFGQGFVSIGPDGELSWVS